MNKPPQFPIAQQSAGAAPLRRALSIRRTTTIDVIWPDGFGGRSEMTGRARDFVTDAQGLGQSVADAHYHISVSAMREILDISASSDNDRISGLKGTFGGGASRKMLAALMSDRIGTPLYQLLDDFAGASLVSGWARTNWPEDHIAKDAEVSEAMSRSMTDICTGFAAGASSLTSDGTVGLDDQSRTPVGTLVHAGDPDGWHELAEQTGPAYRRARRTDVWREGAVIKIDAGFQDSATTPTGGRMAVHEYRLFAEVREADGILLSLDVRPLVLPYAECPGAAVKAESMIGMHVGEFRQSVIDMLRGTMGCTHLNDVLRSLADTLWLIRYSTA